MMKFHPILRTARQIYGMNAKGKIQYPIYQRTTEAWGKDEQRLLIDSMLTGIDIPKLYYFDKGNENYDCIDGHQRTQTIILFLSNSLKLKDGRLFKDLTPKERRKIDNYRFTITVITKATDEDLRKLFLRLQLGVPTNSPERLRAIISRMGDFVQSLTTEEFIKNVGVVKKRFGKYQLCAQICINSIWWATYDEFTNAKFEDLSEFFRDYRDFDPKKDEHARRIKATLERLDEIFGKDAEAITSRANAVSAYLFVENLSAVKQFNRTIIHDFFIDFLSALRAEVRKGFRADNEILLTYQSRVIQGADSKGAITTRDQILKELYREYLRTEKIKYVRLR